MPGLAVILHPDAGGQRPEFELERMLQSMRHEPFYRSGTYSNPELGLYVGWLCHPGSFCDGQPFASTNGNLVLFFHGEHLGDGVAGAASGAGIPANARTVVQLFENYGREALGRLNGWYAGVLLDKQHGEVLVFNDRYGMMRLYTCEADTGHLFASEAKALLAVRPGLRRIDPQGLAEFLSCGCILENRSLFAGVHSLPAGTALAFAREQPPKVLRYFLPQNWEAQSRLGDRQFDANLHEILPRSIRRCVRSALPVGISLTGGFDTRLIMAYLNGDCARIPAYTFGGMYRECFDVRIAREVARICGCRYHVLQLDEDFLKDFPALAEKTVSISDGTLGATNAYELYLNRLARQVAPVRLTGSMGSEVMRGARAFKAQAPVAGLVHPEFQPHIDRAVETFGRLSQGHNLSFSVFKQAPWLYANRLGVEQSQVNVRTPFMDNELVGLMYRRSDNSCDGRELARRLIAQENPALARLPTDTGNCSLIRQKLSEFLFKADYCYKSGMPQWLEAVHHILGPLPPQRWIIGTHRFAHFRVWFRQQLGAYVREILLDPRTAGRPYFNQGFVTHMVERHLKGDRNYTDDLERVLTIELACRSFIDT